MNPLDHITEGVAIATERLEAARGRALRLMAGRETAIDGNGRHTQSVDELIAIMRASTEVEGQQAGASRPLTDNEAVQSFRRWQYAAITAIAEAVMMTPWIIEMRKGDTWEAAPDHPLAKMLESANEFTTGPELTYWTVVELQLIGRSYWQVVGNSLGEPAELWPMLGAVSPIIDKSEKPKHLIKGWKQIIIDKGVRRTQEFEREEVVYLRLPKPGDMFGGYGPLQATSAATRLADEIIESQWSAFKHGLFPSALLKFSARNAEDRERILDEFTERYAGARRDGKAIGVGSDVDVDFLSRTPREMSYHTGSKDLRDLILGTLRVPEAILGISATVNKASVSGMEYIFAKWRVSPLLRLVDARVDQDLAKARFGDDVRARHESPVPSDRDFERQKRDTDMRHGIATINEAREDDGREPAPYGDVPYLPLGMQPIGTPPPAGGQAQVAPEPVTLAAKPKGFGAAMRRELFGRYARDRVKLEARLRRTFAKELKAIGRDVLAAWQDAKEDFGLDRPRIMLAIEDRLDDPLDVEKLAERLAKAAKPANRFGIVVGGSFEHTVRGSLAEQPWHDGLGAIDRYMAEYGPAHYGGVADVTRDHYMAVVRKGIADGATWDELRLEIARQVGIQSEARAANVATTETTKLYGSGADGFRTTYEVPFKQWVTSFVNSRETHVRVDGTTIRNEDFFYVGADRMRFPGDGLRAEENCNCNCVVVGTFDEK